MLGLFSTNYYGTGWMPSALSYDLCSGTEWGVRNIHFNQLYQHRQTMSHIHDVPMFNYNCGSSYFGPTFAPLDQIIKQTLGYADWQNRMQGGNGLIDKNGQFNPMGLFSNGWNNPMNNGYNISTPGFNYNPVNPWYTGYQTNPFNNNGNNGNNGNNSQLSEAEIKNKKEYEKLTNLLGELASYTDLSDEQKASIEFAQNEVNKKESYADKVAVIKEAFKKIGPETIKESLIFSKKDTEGAYRSALKETGWEDSSKVYEKELPSLVGAIENIGKKDSTIDGEDLAWEIMNESSILTVLSVWYSKYPEKQHVMNLLLDKYYSFTKNNESGTRENIESIIKSVTTALRGNAYQFIENNGDKLTQGQIDAIEENIERLEKIQEYGLPEKNDGKLTKVFDELYMQLRIAQVQVINKEVVEKYGIADPEKRVFNDDLFVKETKADLVSEGFKAEEIKEFTLVKDLDDLTPEEKDVKNKEKAKEIADELDCILPKGNKRVQEGERNKILNQLAKINKDNVVEILKEIPNLADRITYVNDWGKGFGIEEVKEYIIQPLLDKYGELEAPNGKRFSSLDEIKDYLFDGLKQIINKAVKEQNGLDIQS